MFANLVCVVPFDPRLLLSQAMPTSNSSFACAHHAQGKRARKWRRCRKVAAMLKRLAVLMECTQQEEKEQREDQQRDRHILEPPGDTGQEERGRGAAEGKMWQRPRLG